MYGTGVPYYYTTYINYLIMLQDLDTQLFLYLNSHYNDQISPFMLWATGDKAWIPFYVCIIGLLIWRFRAKSIPLFIVIALTITAADQFASGFMKPTVQRLRPCYEPKLVGKVHLVTPSCGGKYGFVSSHAANTFALAMLLTMFAKKFKQTYSTQITITMFAWATLVSYTRIYVGVHYPADILFGAIAGVLIAYLLTKLAILLFPNYLPQMQKKEI
jgi:undecaprenyl-diphosphatase